MPLHIEYRPDEWNEVYGNAKVLDALQKTVEKEDPPHAFLFTGPSGCGKTTLARIVADKLGVGNSDYHEVDSGDFRGIDTVREIRRRMYYLPNSGDCAVWLIDECHKMTNDAQNALLKALEEPPAHVYFILATTDPQKLIKTIKTRCSTYNLTQLSDDDLTNLLQGVIGAEGFDIGEEVMEALVGEANGCPRQALVILEQIGQLEDSDSQLQVIAKGLGDKAESIELCRALMRKGVAWKDVTPLLRDLDADAEGVRRHILGYCQSVLLKTSNKQAYLILDAFREPFYDIGKPGLVMACYEVVHGN